MAAGITDKFTETTNGTRPVPTTLTALRSVAATSISCGALTGWPTATAVHFIIYTTDTAGNKVAGSQLDCKGIVSGTTITNIQYKAGTDNGNSIGAIVEAAPTAAWADDVTEGIVVEHNQNGTHAAITATSLVASGNSTAASHISTGDAQLRSVSLETIHSHFMYDFIQSGLVITADSVGVNKNYSMTSGVVYINGRRVAVNSVSAQTVGASKDRYIDVDNTGTLLNTEVANNAASPALAANSIRLGIVVAGATTIATTASINQGQEDRVLPIASSIAYSVTDSLGNLITPRDPNRRILGYKQIIAGTTTTSTSAAQIAGLAAAVIVPTGRKVKVTVQLSAFYSNTNSRVIHLVIWNGVVGSGTQFADVAPNFGASAGSMASLGFIEGINTPVTNSVTYNAGWWINAAGTLGLDAGTQLPAFIKVELV